MDDHAACGCSAVQDCVVLCERHMRLSRDEMFAHTYGLMRAAQKAEARYLAEYDTTEE